MVVTNRSLRSWPGACRRPVSRCHRGRVLVSAGVRSGPVWSARPNFSARPAGIDRPACGEKTKEWALLVSILRELKERSPKTVA